jgi:hypothetical protein
MSPEPPAGPPPEEPTQPLDAKAIGRELDRLTRRVQQLGDAKGWDDDLRGMWKTIRHLGDGLTALLAPAGKDDSSAWLLQVGEEPEKLAERLTDLVEWLDKVFLRYPGTELPSCWLWHPAVIEELLWLRAYHAQAYGPQGNPTAQGMWHDQSLPRLVERIRKYLGSCSLQDHKPGGQAAKDPAAAPLAGHIGAIVESWTTTGLPPEPSDEQLEDARRHRELKLHRNAPNRSSSI